MDNGSAQAKEYLFSREEPGEVFLETLLDLLAFKGDGFIQVKGDERVCQIGLIGV